MSQSESTTAAAPRHSWLKLRLHVYMCIRCGAGYENIQDRTGGWYRRWFLPDRSTVNTLRTLPCEPGPTTAKRILHYSAQLLALADGRPQKLKMLRASIDRARGGSVHA